MAEGVADAAQTTQSAPVNGHAHHNGHSGPRSGAHAGHTPFHTGMNGNSTTRRDKGKEPERTSQPMDIDPVAQSPGARPIFPPPQQNGVLDRTFGMDPEDVSLMMSTMDDPANEDWDAIEENWYAQMRETQAKEDQQLLDAYTAEESVKVAELEEAISDHNRLLEDLFQARVLVDGKVDSLHCLLSSYEKKKKEIEDGRDASDLRVRSWIASGRKAAAEARRKAAPNDNGYRNRHHAYDDEPAEYSSSHGAPLAESPFHQRLHGAIQRDDQHTRTRSSSYGHRQDQPQAGSAESSQGPETRPPSRLHEWDEMDIDYTPKDVTEVLSANGIKIGTLRSIPLMNHWIDSLLQFPVLRTVEIRLGRKFTPAHLEAVYEGPDLKKSKWLSFMIQATGQVQDRACQTCAKGQGLFSLCIIVGGPDFPRCGNCEWNKHGCHGAAGPINNILPDFHGQAKVQQRPRPDVIERNKFNKIVYPAKPHINYKKSVALYTKAMNLEEPPIKSAASSQAGEEIEPPGSPPGSVRKTGRGRSKPKTGAPPSRSSQRRKSSVAPTPGNLAPETPNAGENAEQSFVVKEMTPFDATEEITEDTLALRDDGMIYMEPELMRGVPRRKITPEHAYWDPSWRSLENYVKSKFDEWVSKLNALKAIPEASLTDKDRTAIFQAGRQINRGTAILKYLSKCDTHPYQLVAKSFITPSFTHYDTLFRMVATIDELGKFRLTVSPIDWLRHRLYEIHREMGDSFKLDRVIAKLYHDPKLSYLRSKNGFGNIGRPSVGNNKSGAADGSGGDGGGGPSPANKRRGEKRRERELRDSAASTPTRKVFTDAEKQAARDLAPRSKRQKKTADAVATVAALAPASVTAVTQASRPAITPKPPKNSARSHALAALAMRVLSTSPALSPSNLSEPGSPLSTPSSSRAVSRSDARAADDQDGSRYRSQVDGMDDSYNDNQNAEQSEKSQKSQKSEKSQNIEKSQTSQSDAAVVESHHISHNDGGYTDSEGDNDDDNGNEDEDEGDDNDSDEDDDNDNDDSDADVRGRKRTRTRNRNSNIPRSNVRRRSHGLRPKRTSRAVRAIPNEELDIDYSGYTSRDSLTNDTVVKKDWRVLQVKTRELTSNPRTTQYWHWVDERHAHQMSGPGGPSDFDPMFEHQVLKETEPTTGWGVFREPINFHLRLRELKRIQYASDSAIIVIETARCPDFPHRGNVLARFKRERTKRRFLVFMKKKGVPLEKRSRDEIEEEWDELSTSELMPGNESD